MQRIALPGYADPWIMWASEQKLNVIKEKTRLPALVTPKPACVLMNSPCGPLLLLCVSRTPGAFVFHLDWRIYKLLNERETGFNLPISSYITKLNCSVSQFSKLRKLKKKKKRKRKWLKVNRFLKEAETTVTEILMPLGHYLGKKRNWIHSVFSS